MLQGRTITAAALLAMTFAAIWVQAMQPTVVLAITMSDLDAQHTEVLALYSARGPIGCSAVTIGSRIVLTAGHCVAGVTTALRLLEDTGYGGATVTSFPVATMYVHPHFDPGQRVNDLAMLITGTEIETVSLFLGAADAETILQPGTEVVVVGFGMDRTGSRGQPARRSGRAKIEAVSATELRLLAAPAQPCAGDSGGAVFVETVQRRMLVGIISSGDPDCRLYSRAMRIDAYWQDFLEPLAKRARHGSASE